MEDDQWDVGYAKSLGVFFNGDALERGRRGEEHRDDSFLLLFNAHHETVAFTVPAAKWGTRWATEIDTDTGVIEEDGTEVKAGDEVNVAGRSAVVLRRIE